MSSAVSGSTEIKEPAHAPNGTLAPPVRRPAPPSPSLAAPFAVLVASVVAARILRRRRGRPAKPSVNWSLSVATGNHVYFRPTLAPRLSGVLIGGRRRGRATPRRLFRR